MEKTKRKYLKEFPQWWEWVSTDRLKALSAIVSAWLEVWAMFKETARDCLAQEVWGHYRS